MNMRRAEVTIAPSCRTRRLWRGTCLNELYVPAVVPHLHMSLIHRGHFTHVILDCILMAIMSVEDWGILKCRRVFGGIHRRKVENLM